MFAKTYLASFLSAMAMKAMLFVLAYMLVLTTKAMAHAPAAPAKTPPVLTPKKAPAYAPMPHVYPPVKSESPEPPVLTPKKAPAYAPMPHVYPPVKSESPEPPKYHGCSDGCWHYCDKHHTMGEHKKRYCQRICAACCKKCKCFPSDGKTCTGWDEIVYHGTPIKCP
ncbi:unnamed protein product [Camellia sinensis]